MFHNNTVKILQTSGICQRPEPKVHVPTPLDFCKLAAPFFNYGKKKIHELVISKRERITSGALVI